MTFRLFGINDKLLDAHLDIEGSDIIFHSRGGSRGRPGARNLDYGPGLRLILQRLSAGGCRLEGAWLDSDDVGHIDLDRRQILEGAELAFEPNEQFRIMSNRMQSFGRPQGAPYGGSRVKKVRLRVSRSNDSTSLEVLLNLKWVASENRRRRRVTAVDLEGVTAEHLWNAVQCLTEDLKELPRIDVGDFEVLVNDDIRLSPKDIVDLALCEALGLEGGAVVTSGDVESHCHRILRDAGFIIVQRGDATPQQTIPVSDDDRVWAEGRPALVVHLRRERAAGLVLAKKQSFVRLHGALWCERCGLDPVATFGSEVGSACIEVHHDRTLVAEMEEGHRTMLTDLQCLCANCHRIVHARLRKELGFG